MSDTAIPNRTATPITLRDAAWLTAAVVLVAAPHAERLPLWLTGLAAAMSLWRVYLARARVELPGRWLLVLIVIASVAVIFLHYRTLFGRDAGVALLTLMLSLKLMETRTRRDGMILVFIGYFLVITNFFYTQSIPTAIYLLGCVWFITAAMIGLQYTQAPAAGYAAGRARKQLRLSAVLLAQAAPLMIVFFVLFPRVQGPLWGMPTDAYAGLTGLSDNMSPGTINKLIFSDDVALRAEFQGPVPPPNKLYWRGPVLLDFDGRTWNAPPRPMLNRVDLDQRANAVYYTVAIEPHNRRWLFALDLPSLLPPRSTITPEHLLLSLVNVNSRMRYEMSSYLEYTVGTQSSRAALYRALQLPPGYNPRTVALGAELRARHGAGGNEAIMNAALALFREEKFTYTVEPPLLGRDSVDEFLFSTRAGFCEHFSSAFAVLMRAAGVPARVATGYLGGEFNPLGNYLIVRQSDAHAWNEIWIEDRGWVRVDPTNQVSPARAEGGLSAAVPDSVLLTGGSRFSTWFAKNPLFHQLALTWDSIANRWNQTVLGYNLESQRALLYRAGLDGDTLRTLAALLVGVTIVAMAVLALLTLARRNRTNEPAQAAYQRFCDKAARAGLQRGAAEGPLDFAARIANARPELAQAARDITRLYVALRYAQEHEKSFKNKYLLELRQHVKAFTG